MSRETIPSRVQDRACFLLSSGERASGLQGDRPMLQEPTSQPGTLPTDESAEPTQPRIPVQQLAVKSAQSVFHVRYSRTYTVSIDEQGLVTLLAPGQPAVALKSDEAFDLLDFLFAYRNFLAARSAEIAEQQGEMHQGCE